MSKRSAGRRTRRRGLSALLATLLALMVALPMGGASAVAQVPSYTPPVVSPFTDVATSNAAYTEIAWMWEEGISTGWPDGTYRPTQQVDRDAMAAFFYRYKESPPFTAPTTSCFADITTSTQFFKEMCWMKDTGISTGWDDNTYRPWTVTYRDAMSAFLYRVAGSPNYTPPATSKFTDITTTTQFYKEMSWLAEMGIATGVEDGTFDPWTPVTRSMMATFMYRLANLSSLQVATTALPSGTVGQPYTVTLAASGGTTPHSWQAKNLPAGLSLNGDTISGTPTAVGASAVEVTVTDNAGATATLTLGLSIVAPLSITTTLLPVGAVGQAYTPTTLSAAGGVPPVSWTAQGLLPAGLGVSATGEITGTPTAAGVSSVTFIATDLEGRTANKSLSFDIAAAPLSITTTSLPPSTVGDPYTTPASAAGGKTPYSWTISNLPTGFSAAGNTISGTPTAAGTTSVVVEVKDADGRVATKSLNLVVSQPLAITTASLPTASLGVEYSTTLAATGGVPTYTWGASGLPAGLTLIGGTISGTPTVQGTFPVLLSVSDVDGRSTSVTLNMVVDNALVMTTTSLPGATVGKPYSVKLTAAGGIAPYTWSAPGLPAGLSLNGDTISGTPTTAGAVQVTVTVTDSEAPTPQSVSSSMTLAVSEAETGLALLKTVVNPYGTAANATNWTLSADGPGTASDLTGAGGVARTPVAAGTYTLSETGSVAGYTNGTTWTCATTGGTPVSVTNNQVTLAAGADVACTITNTAIAPHLTLKKNVVDAAGAPVPATNWTLKADGPGDTDLSGSGGVARTPVKEGSYTLSETGSVAGYVNGTVWSCATVGGAPVSVTNNNQVTLSVGADVECSITNTANAPYLSLVKSVVNTGGNAVAAANWTLAADGPGASDLSGAGGVARTQVATGTYALSETGTVAGYTNGTTWSCATTGGTPVTVTNNQVTLAAGADVRCTITNTANAPYLSLVKKVVNTAGAPASASHWTLRADGPGATDLAGAGGVGRTKVVEGSYTLSEIGSLSGYSNGTTWSCVDASSAPVAVTNNRVTLGTGADVTCSITNTAIVAAPHIGVGTYSPTSVYRYWNATTRDWVTVPDHGDFGVPAGYGGQEGVQYYVPLIASGADDMVGIYRWYSAADGDWVDIPEGGNTAGYTSRVFQHYLFKSSGTNRVAVNRWWNAADRDWMTVSANEYSDATLQSWGYTNKTLLGYAHATQSNYQGYFSLGTPQGGVVDSSYASGEYPHTMSVLDVNPTNLPEINAGYRYLGYFGHNDCGGINIARSNSLDSPDWYVGGHQPWFPDSWPCRWAFGAIADGSRIALVVNEQWDTTVTLQMSVDGLDGTEFDNARTILYAAGTTGIGNPTLFRDPTNNRYYLYFYRVIPSASTATDYLYELRVKSATTIEGLIGGGEQDLGTRIALTRNVFAAPSMMYANGVYYLATETKEANVWKTRVMTGSSPTGPFYEVPGNPLYVDGAACVFQHQFGTELHAWYCMQTQPGNQDAWRLDHVKGNLLSPN